MLGLRGDGNEKLSIDRRCLLGGRRAIATASTGAKRLTIAPTLQVPRADAVSVEDRRFDAQHLVQLRRGGGVLHMNFLVRENIRRGAESG